MTTVLGVDRRKLREDYHRWHWLQVRERDIDPVYPVLRAVRDMLGLSPDDTAWLCLLHVTYYHLGSALAAFAHSPTPRPPAEALLHLPTGTERRAHRVPGKLRDHWLALLEAFDAHGGPAGWLSAAGTDWRATNEHLATVHGNGRWAAYKTAELTQKVLALPLVVADAGHANSTGPRQGLALLHDIPPGNAPSVIAELDVLTDRLARQLGDPDLGQVETSLCDFHSLVRGRYYLGHDIDAMQEQLWVVPSDLTPVAMAAREAGLPPTYLGELSGWTGVDKARRGVYARTGVIVVR